jgi:hypothetical protein
MLTIPNSAVSLSFDDALVNGRQYTFIFNCSNLFFTPSTDTITQDLLNSAPDFLVDTGVSNDGKTFYVVFTYEGDGTDLVGDVSGSIVAAVAVGGDNFDFVNAYKGALVSIASAGGPKYSFSLLNLLPTYLGGTPVTPEQSQQYTQQGTAEIKTVAANAAATGNQVSVVASEDAVTSQTKAFTSDQQSLANQQYKAASTSDNTMLLIVLAIVAGLLAFLWRSGGVTGVQRRLAGV